MKKKNVWKVLSVDKAEMKQFKSTWRKMSVALFEQFFECNKRKKERKNERKERSKEGKKERNK